MNAARAALILAGALALPAAGAAQACVPSLQGQSVRVMRSNNHVIAWRPEPAPIAVGAHFTVDLAICGVPGAFVVDSIAIDAEMPEHRHGMNYRASLVALGAGRYRAEGLMFHMPGRWRLTVELRAGTAIERLSDELMVN